jgi:hypothetical protein
MTYEVDYMGGACPTQAWGTTCTGERFYFRARSNVWTLQFGEGDIPVDGRRVASGLINEDDPRDTLLGFMDDDEVHMILAAYC